MGKLYLVPTPVGNLEDMTFRAIRVLKEVDLVLAEDTRTSSMLFRKFEIRTPMASHHKFNEHKTSASIAEKIAGGMNVALISDAGTPGISDPGFFLVRECIEAGVDVETLPGATAFVPALVTSGFPTDRFIFEGFLPVKKGRQTKMKEIASHGATTIVYESPYRLVKTLAPFAEIMGPQRRAAVCRETSKLHEECRRGTLEELHIWYLENEPKGEIVLVLSGKDYEGKDYEGERREEGRGESGQ